MLNKRIAALVAAAGMVVMPGAAMATSLNYGSINGVPIPQPPQGVMWAVEAGGNGLNFWGPNADALPNVIYIPGMPRMAGVPGLEYAYQKDPAVRGQILTALQAMNQAWNTNAFTATLLPFVQAQAGISLQTPTAPINTTPSSRTSPPTRSSTSTNAQTLQSPPQIPDKPAVSVPQDTSSPTPVLTAELQFVPVSGSPEAQANLLHPTPGQRERIKLLAFLNGTSVQNAKVQFTKGNVTPLSGITDSHGVLNATVIAPSHGAFAVNAEVAYDGQTVATTPIDFSVQAAIRPPAPKQNIAAQAVQSGRNWGQIIVDAALVLLAVLIAWGGWVFVKGWMRYNQQKSRYGRKR